MKISEAKEYIRLIRETALRGDSEVAHQLEDEFRGAVLKHIATGGACAAQLAKLARSTDAIEFFRWFA